MLKNILQIELNCPIEKEYFWTDSLTVLKYLNNELKRFTRFVSNRVGFILNETEPNQWYYVPSKLNPADHISRGVSISTFIDLEDWKSGPNFLYSHHSDSKDLETTEKLSCLSTMTDTQETSLDKIMLSCSDWHKLKRKVAWFILLKCILAKKKCSAESLTLDELDKAEGEIIRYVQEIEYSSLKPH